MGIWYSLYLHLVLYALESPNTSLKFYATVNLSSTRWPGGIDGLGVLHFMTHCKFLLGCGQWGSDGTLADEAPCLNASLRDSSKNLSNFYFFFRKKKKKRSALSHLSHWVIFQVMTILYRIKMKKKRWIEVRVWGVCHKSTIRWWALPAENLGFSETRVIAAGPMRTQVPGIAMQCDDI